MNTSMLAVAVLSSVLAQGPEPGWRSDYHRAQTVGTAQKKPMALVFGSGPSGWNKIALEGKLEAATAKLLADRYLCVYVDTTDPAGKTLAESFEMPKGLGVVLSDSFAAMPRSGDRTVFETLILAPHKHLRRSAHNCLVPKLK